MQRKTEYLVRLCNEHYRPYGTRIDFLTLADGLNFEGYRTEHGQEYSYTNFRGVARLISCVYNRLAIEGREQDAEDVARTFVNSKGSYAYE